VVLIIISALLSTILMLLSLVICIRGVYHLIAGKCKIRGNALQKREARIVGLVFFLQFPAAMAPWAIIYEAFDLGSGGGSAQQRMANNLTSDFFSIVLFLAAVLGSHFWVRAYAKKNAAPSHSILESDE
jgi:hypothetical protein